MNKNTNNNEVQKLAKCFKIQNIFIKINFDVNLLHGFPSFFKLYLFNKNNDSVYENHYKIIFTYSEFFSEELMRSKS